MSFLYDCDCEDCKTKAHTLAIGKSKIKPLLTAVEKAFKQLHSKGSYKPQDLAKTAEYKNLIAGTSEIFNGAIADNDIPEAMAKSLKDDVFVFSGLKTNAQLAEASKLLLTPEGKIKSFSAFSNDVQSIKENYNQHYLEAEYQFAVSSAQSAGNWANLSSDYDLQYRTAGDDRVRDSHEKLKVTLPQDDAFWLSYYPPNGWRCRCTAVQVRKGKFDLGDSKKAIAEGEKATTQIDKNGKNKLAIFRFNPGVQKVVFPPSHPYTKVAGAKEVRKILKSETLDFKPDGIDQYAKDLGVKVNPEIFTYLNKDTGFKTKKLKDGERGQGAHYNPAGNNVYIPNDERRRKSSWWSEAVVYHEFGHAADWQNGFKKSELVTGLMDKYRKEFRKNKNEGYNSLSAKLREENLKVYTTGDRNHAEKIGAVLDTVMALNKNYGSGHPPSYWKAPGNSEAEFIAHAFENKFAENEVFKKVAPELYEDMRKLIDELKPKAK